MIQTILYLTLALASFGVSARQNSARFLAQQTLRASICEQEQKTYDPATGRCFDPRQEPSEFNCAILSEHFDPINKTCVSPSSLTKRADKEKRFLPIVDPEDTPGSVNCKLQNLLFDPATQKCFNPQAHPSVCNCAYLGLNFNAATLDCVWDAASQAANDHCQTMTLLYNPNTQKCYNPTRHPSECNCGYYALSFNSWTSACVPWSASALGDNVPTSVSPPQPDSTPLPYCQPGSLPDYNTKQCVACGACMTYPLNVGQQVCLSGQCSVICPDNSWAKNRWGIQYCA